MLLKLVSLTYVGAMDRVAEATVKLESKGETSTWHEYSAKGPFDAFCRAVQHIVPQQVTFDESTVHSQKSAASTGQVSMTLKKGDGTFEGCGRHADPVVASALAYVDALNKLRIFEAKQKRYIQKSYVAEPFENLASNRSY